MVFIICVIDEFLVQILSSHHPHNLVFEARTTVATFGSALEQFKIGVGRYPSKEEGLAGLMKRPAAIPESKWVQYLGSPKGLKFLIDPWGHPYVYRFPGVHNTNDFDVYSFGLTGKESDYSIDNWTPTSYQLEQLSIARGDLLIFTNALGRFQADCGRLPTSEEGLPALRERPSTIPAAQWRGPYVGKVKDPWGRPYLYKWPGSHNTNGFDISSEGPNGQPGGEGEIGNWALPN
jgi:type II secretion system protein G